MAEFQTDNNIPDRLVRELIGFGHRVVTARQNGLIEAPDAVQLLHAARNGRILLTADRGYSGLHEAWHYWMVETGFGTPHAGIVWIQTAGAQLATQIASRLHGALTRNWEASANLWQLNARHGWKRATERSSTRAEWVPGYFCDSPLDIP